MLAEVTWILAIPASIFGAVCLSLTVVICVCGCKTRENKDELVGIEGHVKITNPEDYQHEVNANNISSNNTIVDKTHNTAKRSLPDLPIDQSVNGRGDVVWEPNGDATSELYATVVLQDEKNKKHNRQKSESDSVSPSMTYAQVKEHPYDKLKKVEHPYAQVKNKGVNNPATSTSHQSNLSEESNSRGQNSEVTTPDRPLRESSGDIHAATAIAGHVTASDDLPYMTPPAHFSGDSQDSGKGYTSISVREPLSAIRAETKTTTATTTNRRNDPHYASVSDDSDDMYAAIDDPSQVYTSESETYAQIQPGANRAAQAASAPQPPSVDSLKQMTVSSQSHSRQASSSSAASSTAVNSPKPDKRPANSPLPPPPAKSQDSLEDLYSSIDKTTKPQGSPRNLEDMYAKVNKKIRRDLDVSFERGASTESGLSESSDSVSYKVQSSNSKTETSRSCHSCSSTKTDSSTTNRKDATDSSFSSDGDLQLGYERLGGGSSFEFDVNPSDPGYETVNKGPPSDADPNYEQLKPQEHDYASIARTKRRNNENDGYASVDRLESDASDGYARVQSNPQVDNEIYSKIDNCGSDGYARVEHTDIDGYAKVLKHNNNSEEPNYEQVRFQQSVQLKHSDPVSEPTYESLGNEFDVDDPNYESVRYNNMAHIEPPYQLLRDCESGTAKDVK